jgi:hypothetical protein
MIPTEENLVVMKSEFKSKYLPILGEHGEFYGEPGDRPYLLLSWYAYQLRNKTILVLDAYRGLSSLALSFESSNTVHAFSNKGLMDSRVLSQRNIHFHDSDLMDASILGAWKTSVLACDVIFLDCSPHDGENEYRFYEFLRENNYGGILLCDHIWEKKEMRDSFFYKISDKYRYDLSLIGSHTGTLMVGFSQESVAEIARKKADLSRWTLVTAYFNLTECPDASAEIKARDANYYFHYAKYTLCMPYNLVVYCDEESLPKIKEIRPAEYKTKYVVTVFDDIRVSPAAKTFAEYRVQIIQNRKEKPYRFDARNTASYYLFCLSRYWMLRETIRENPFGSTHFCWINFCMERMGYKNVLHLEECLSVYRDKFSTCYIDFVPKGLVENTSEYFTVGRCSMCSGFFTGSGEYMSSVCGLIIKKFQKYVEEGYGHADEQLYSPVFFENRDLFDQYFGDYTEMITNYKYVYDRATEPVRNFIRNSFQHGEYGLCLKACHVMIESIGLGKCGLDDSSMRDLEHYFTQSMIRLHLLGYKVFF